MSKFEKRLKSYQGNSLAMKWAGHAIDVNDTMETAMAIAEDFPYPASMSDIIEITKIIVARKRQKEIDDLVEKLVDEVPHEIVKMIPDIANWLEVINER